MKHECIPRLLYSTRVYVFVKNAQESTSRHTKPHKPQTRLRPMQRVHTGNNARLQKV
jgi:hypothetical protein